MNVINLKMIIKLILLFLNFQIGHSNKIEIIADIIKSYNKPSQIQAFVCSQRDILKFAKSLFNMNIMFGMQNIYSTPFTNIFPSHEMVFILNLNCTNSNQLLQYANDINLFRSPYRWIIYNDNIDMNYEDHYQQFLEMSSSINILVDSDIILILPINNTDYKLITVYQEAVNFTLKQEDYAYWNQIHGLHDIIENHIIATRRINLNQVVLKTVIVITDNDTYGHLTDYKDPDVDSITKANYFIVKHAAEIMNASLSYIVERTWGYRNKTTNQWSGLIGRLHEKHAHIAGTALFMTRDRVPIVQYLTMATPTKSKFVFRQPKLSFVTNVYQLPFQINCWIATIFLVIITGMSLYVATKWENNYKHRLQKDDDSIRMDASLEEIIFISVGAVCQQGAHALPTLVSGRLISILLYFALMFLYTSYAANIVSLLQMPSTKIKTLADLLHSRLELGVHDTVFNRFYFPASTEPIRKAIYEQKVAPRGKAEKFMTMEEGVQRMRAGLFAFHFEEGAGYKRIQETFFEHEKCGLKDLSYLQVPYPFLCVQKNLSYTEHLKIAYTKINERGFNNREVNRIYTKKPHCESHGSGFISVGLVDCYPLAVILCIGVLTSLFCFFLEAYFHLSMRKDIHKKIYRCCERKLKKIG